MITVLYGSRRALDEHPDLQVIRERDFPLDSLPAERASWLGPRRLLPFLVERRGARAVEKALSPHLGPISLCLGLPAEDLDREQQREREAASGLFWTSLPYPGGSPTRLAQAWALALAPLIDGLGLRLIIRACARVDRVSIDFLRRLLAILADRVEVVLGLGPPPGEPVTVAERAAYGSLEGLRLLAAGASRWLDLGGDSGGGPGGSEPPPPVLHPLDRAPDLLAWQALGGVREGRPGAVDVVVHGVSEAVSCFGFWAALALGDSLLAETGDFPGRAFARRLAGVAEFNCGAGNRENEAPAVAHFRAALAGEIEPLHRAALLDRLALSAARTGDASGALALGDEAVLESRRVAGDLQPLVEAWARSGHAFPLFVGKRHADARAECERADELLRGVIESTPALRVPALIGRFHVVNNLCRVAFSTGDRERARRYQAELDACEDALPFEHWQYPGWTSIAVVDDDLAAARARRERYLQLAVEVGEPRLELLHAHNLIEVLVRQGDTAQAYRGARRILDLREIPPATSVEVTDARTNCAVIALLAGLWPEARALLVELAADPTYGEPEGRAMLAASFARLAAGEGDAAGLDKATGEVGALLPEIGAGSTLVVVLTSVARALLVADRRPEALAALAPALAAARADSRIPAEEAFALRVAALECGAGPEDALLAEAIALAPRALDDVNAWAELPRIMPLVRAAVDAGTLGDLGPLQKGLDRLAGAARQRRDAG